MVSRQSKVDQYLLKEKEKLSAYGFDTIREENELRYEFKYDERLGIETPYLYTDWMSLTSKEQEELLYRWEAIRASIPDRIKTIESRVTMLEKRLQIEDQDERFYQLSSEISQLAAIIIDLQLWFRTQENITSKDDTKLHM